MYTMPHIVDSNKSEHGRRMIYASFACFVALGLEDGHVSIFWLAPRVGDWKGVPAFLSIAFVVIDLIQRGSFQ